MRSLISRPAEQEAFDAQTTPAAAKWESERTPEAFYARVSEVTALFTEGRYTSAVASQRVLDLLYDIDRSPTDTFTAQVKSRYYLLIFTCISEFRSVPRRFADVLRGRAAPSDQTMYVEGIDFSGLSLPGLRLRNTLLKGCDFSAANLSLVELQGCTFEGVTLTACDLSSALVRTSSFAGCDFSKLVTSRGQKPLRVLDSSFVACSFRGGDLRGAEFRRTRLVGCDLVDANRQDVQGL